MAYFRTRTDLQALGDSATITAWPPAVHVEGNTPTLIVAVGGMIAFALARHGRKRRDGARRRGPRSRRRGNRRRSGDVRRRRR
jgi:hypothetical protein